MWERGERTARGCRRAAAREAGNFRAQISLDSVHGTLAKPSGVPPPVFPSDVRGVQGASHRRAERPLRTAKRPGSPRRPHQSLHPTAVHTQQQCTRNLSLSSTGTAEARGRGTPPRRCALLCAALRCSALSDASREWAFELRRDWHWPLHGLARPLPSSPMLGAAWRGGACANTPAGRSSASPSRYVPGPLLLPGPGWGGSEQGRGWSPCLRAVLPTCSPSPGPLSD